MRNLWKERISLLSYLCISAKPVSDIIDLGVHTMTTSHKMMLRTVVSVTILAAAFLPLRSANAQLGEQTGIADPGRLEKSLTDQKLVPQVGPDVKVKELAAVKAPEGAEKIKFNFGGVIIEGANAYEEDDLLPLYQDMIGQEISLADLYAVANRMTAQYRNDGYILTQVVVPPQTIEDGIARLQVVEGFIDNVTIQGGDENDFALQMMRDYASRISAGGAMNTDDMERQLLLINDLPGVTARSVISPSATTPGGADMLIIIERDPFDGIVGVNNHGSKFLGPWQGTGAMTFNSIFGLNEAITTQAVLAPDSGIELAFGSVGYEQPVGPWGTKLSVTGSITDTDPGHTLSPFEVEGLSRSVVVQATHPVIRSRSTNMFARVSADWRNVESQNNVELTRKDRIRAVRAGAQIEFLERLLGVAVNTIDVSVAQGLNIFGASDQGDANMTRAAGDPQFTKANIQVQRLQRITNSVNIQFSGRGQWASNALLSSEEFGLGGINTIRGFSPSEVVGDDGIAGNIELQWKTPVKQLQVFGFVDSGRVWDKDPTTAAGKRNSLTSVGGGVRFDLPLDVDGEFVAAKPLNRDIQVEGDRDTQLLFSLNKKF